VINCAAYTNVDGAERDIAGAMRINRDGALYAAQAAKDCGARMIHVSTDYVFDGKLRRPLREEDPTAPLGVYGQSKLEGEEKIRGMTGLCSSIVRTSWLHGRSGKNFVQTMLRLFAEQPVIKVVNDQFGSPTWTGWLADVLLDLSRMDVHGVLHATCSGETNWYDFTQEILRLVRDQVPTLKVSAIEPQTTAQAARLAQRPAYSVLDCGKLEGLLGRKAMSWQDGLRNHLLELGFKV